MHGIASSLQMDACHKKSMTLLRTGNGKGKVPPLALGDPAGGPDGGGWVIRASPQQPPITAFPLVVARPTPAQEALFSTATAADSIATAKRQLASYSWASHATAQRAVTGARAALDSAVDGAGAGSNSGAEATSLAGTPHLWPVQRM